MPTNKQTISGRSPYSNEARSSLGDPARHGAGGRRDSGLTGGKVLIVASWDVAVSMFWMSTSMETTQNGSSPNCNDSKPSAARRATPRAHHSRRAAYQPTGSDSLRTLCATLGGNRSKYLKGATLSRTGFSVFSAVFAAAAAFAATLPHAIMHARSVNRKERENRQSESRSCCGAHASMQTARRCANWLPLCQCSWMVRMLHGVCRTRHAVCCVRHVVCCTRHVVCGMLHACATEWPACCEGRSACRRASSRPSAQFDQ